MNAIKVGVAAITLMSLSSLAWAESDDPEVRVRMPENVNASSDGSDDEQDDDIEILSCPYVRGDLVKVGYSATGNVSNPWKLFSAASNLTCLEKEIIKPIMNKPIVKARNPKYDGYWDDEIAWEFSQMFFPQIKSWDLGKDAEADEVRTTYSKKGAICYRESYYHVGGQGCSVGTVFFDLACNVVDTKTVIDFCGGVKNVLKAFELDFLRSSPISLLWDETIDIEESAAVVSFPIDPTYKNAWYTWKGSEKAPLLVYNPTHDGVISSGEQLFGPWTFGGKRTAMKSERGVLGQPWRDGYEALSTLDRNGDGELSGGELEPLALWFDKNQDAVSQPGEVKTLSQAGVEKVFFKSNRVDGVTKSIFADKGFVRIENGKRIHGGSVDWFADTAATPGELVNKHSLGALIRGSGTALAEPPTSAPKSEPAADVAKTTNERDPLVGVWQWSYGDQPEAGIQGYILMGANSQESKVRGYSLIGNRLAYTPGNIANETVSFVAFNGDFERAENGKRIVKYSSKHGGTTLRTEAELSADGKMLTATTTAYVEKNSKYHKLSYRWTALKVPNL